MNLIPQKSEYKGMICVYKLLFDNSFFYIGSTSNLKQRITVHNCVFSGKKIKGQSRSMIAARELYSNVEVIILEQLNININLLEREDFFIRQFSNTPLLINRSKTAFYSSGIKWTDEEKNKISKSLRGIKRSEDTIARMKNKTPDKIKKYSIDGLFIKAYSSQKAAALDSGISRLTLRRVMYGVIPNYKGFVYRYL